MKLYRKGFLGNKWLIIIPLHVKYVTKPKQNSSSSKTSILYFAIYSFKELFLQNL